ncbi:MAG: AEC family transporter [Desulfomonilia bacterium]
MNLFITTFTAVATLLTIGIVGFWLLSRRILIENLLGPLSVLAIDIALPCLIFVNILQNFDPERYPLWWTLPLWWIAFTGVAGTLSFVSARLSSYPFRREFRFALFFQNGIFFPLAIIAEMYTASSPYLVDLFLFTIFYPAFFFNTAPMFFGKKIRSLDMKRIINPVLGATILAVTLRMAGLHAAVPEFITSGLRLIGAMAVPLLMIILGGNIFIDMQKQDKLNIGETVKFVLLKNIIFPLAVLGVLILVHPPYHISLIVMIQSAVPPITAVPILTEREGGNRAIVNQFMVASFLVSLVTLPLVLALFGRIFAP